MQMINALALAACLFSASCNLTKKHWTYRLTRDAAETGYWSFARDVGGSSTKSITNNANAAAVFIGVVLLLPPILDTAFLPIAGTHDLFFID